MNQDQITNTVAAAGVSSPLWLPSLHTVSATASAIVPILGAVWLTVQIVIKLIETHRSMKNDKDED